MIKAYLLTAWELDQDPEVGYTYQIWIDLGIAGVRSVGDTMTDQPSSPPAHISNPNVLVIEAVLNNSTYDWILASPKYGEGAILWSTSV